MKLSSTPKYIYRYFILLIPVLFLVNQSCNTDDSNIEKTSDTRDGIGLQLNPEENGLIKTISFSPIHDAHIQDGYGKNDSLLYIAENSHSSYLKFDLTPIKKVNGQITDVTLELTSLQTDTDGEILLYMGESNSWTERDLSYDTAPNVYPEIENSIIDSVATKKLINLKGDDIKTDTTTIVMDYRGESNFTFYSKEAGLKNAPKLVVSIYIPIEDSTTLEEIESIDTSLNNLIEESLINVDNSGQEITEEANIPTSQSGSKNEVGSIKLVKATASVSSSTPKAVITANQTSGKAPFRVWFTGDKSTDDKGITNYLWKFKDGRQNATVKNPIHTFEKPGTYQVSLTVKNAQGLTNTKTITITATNSNNTAPVALLSANKVTGVAPFRVSLYGNKSTDDKAVKSYLWKFKDGRQNATISNPIHTFNNPGTYAVELTVKDAEGLSSTKSITITATGSSNQNPIAKISADKTTGNAPLRVSLRGDQSSDDNAVVSYLWKFKDGEQNATVQNPVHTFEKPGTYAVELTVKDAQGLNHTSVMNIKATQGSSGSAPAGSFYVTTSGSSNNDGLSESKAWNLQKALNNAKAGDNVYIKAGDYGNVKLQPMNSGTSGNPIRFIGYKSVPGDIVASGGSTFKYGESLDSSKMPLLRGKRNNSVGEGTGIYNFRTYVEFSNFQITQYGEGVFSSGDHTVLDNIIVTEIGDFNPAHTYPTRTSNQSLNYAGVGIKVSGDYSIIKNCFVLNAGAEGYRFSDCKYQTHTDNKAYSDSTINPCDYYYLLALGADNNDLSNIYVERVGDLEHAGHGLVLKFDAQNNQIRNSTVKNTWLELSYSDVAYNTFTNCTVIGGNNTNDGALLIANGAHNNTFQQCRVTSCDGVSFSDWDEDFSRGDVRNAGHHNTFKQCTFDNNLAGVNFFWYSQNNKNYKAHDNTFDGCTFRDMDQLFMVDRVNSNTLLKNCTIINIDKLKGSYYPTVNSDISLNAQFQNNSVQSSGFTIK